MNSLHQLIESANAGPEGRFEWSDSLSKEHLFRVFRAIVQDASKAVCFDMGEIPPEGDLPQIEDAGVPYRLPYPVCWFEACGFDLDGRKTVWGFLCEQQDSGPIGITTFLRCGTRQRWACEGLAKMDAMPFVQFESEGIDQVVQKGFARSIAHFVVAMSCRNVVRREIKPDAALQKARAKRGKQPLFSYWVLEINGSREVHSEALGGTHASPRVHLRRGHPRQFAPGRFTWVQPAVVGNKKLGMVHKDYAAGPGLMSSSTLH